MWSPIVLLALLTSSADALSANVLAKGQAKSGTALSMLKANKKKLDAMQRIEVLEKWEDSGLALSLHPSIKAEKIQKSSNQISEKAYDKQLHAIADLGSRFVLHSGNSAAENYLLTELAGMGYEVSLDKFAYQTSGESLMELGHRFSQEAEISNVVAFKEGTDLKEETIVIGAHLDSVNWKSGTDTAAPGVDDNASGLAAVLLVAKQLSKLELRRSVAVIAFNAEEEGLLGSKHFIQAGRKAYPWGEGITAALIADEVAFAGRETAGIPQRSAIFETSGKNEANTAIVDTMAHNVEDSKGSLANFEVNYRGFGSDHMSFLMAGIPSVLLIERDDEWHADAVGHSSQDTFDGLSMDFGATMARLLFRTAANLASPE